MHTKIVVPQTLQALLRSLGRMGLGFSSGVDSAYLLYAAKASGCAVHAYFIKSAFQPQFELLDAQRLARELESPLTVLNLPILDNLQVASNPADRCYHCKTTLFTHLKHQALADGCQTLVDGTNASDRVENRPGMRALTELGVRSPLREAGLVKEEIRRLSLEAGLFTHNKPSYACLATRIPTGTQITTAQLEAVEQGEDKLSAMGFVEFRLRLSAGGDAMLEVTADQLERAFLEREALLGALKPLFPRVTLNLKGRDCLE